MYIMYVCDDSIVRTVVHREEEDCCEKWTPSVQSSLRYMIFTVKRKCVCTVPYTCTKTRTVQAAASLHDVPSAVPGSKCVHVGVGT